MATRTGIWSQMQHTFCEKIKAGVLIAEGVQTRPSLGDGLEEIPAFLFDHPKLDGSSIENFGHRFEGVIVRKGGETDTPGSPPARAAMKSSPEPKRRPGRPSKTAGLDAAINALVAQGAELDAIDRKRATHLVKQKAEELGISTRSGFSDSAVQRALLNRFGLR